MPKTQEKFTKQHFKKKYNAKNFVALFLHMQLIKTK
jgi:hypothetical protein